MSRIIKNVKPNKSNVGWEEELSSYLFKGKNRQDPFQPFFLVETENAVAENTSDFDPAQPNVLDGNSTNTAWQALNPNSLSDLVMDEGHPSDQSSFPENERLNTANKSYAEQPRGLESKDVDRRIETAPDDPKMERQSENPISDNLEVETISEEPESADLKDTEAFGSQRKETLQSSDIKETATVLTYEEGIDIGYQRGMKEGKADAEQLAENISRKSVDQVHALLSSVPIARREFLEGVESSMKTLAIHLARQLVRGELSLSAQAITQLIKASLDKFHEGAQLTVFLNPNDFSLLKTSTTAEMDYKLLADEKLNPGSVRIKNGGTRTEDLMEERLSELTEQIFGNIDAALKAPISTLTKSASDQAHTKSSATIVDSGKSADGVLNLEGQEDCELGLDKDIAQEINPPEFQQDTVDDE